MILIPMSLMISDSKMSKMSSCLLSSCIFFGKMSIQVICSFLIESFGFIVLLLSPEDSLYILDINSLSDIWFANFLSCLMGLFFRLLIAFLNEHKFGILVYSNFIYFSSCCLALGILSKKLFPNPVSCSFSPMVFIVFVLLFCFLRQCLAIQPRLALNSISSSLSLLNAGIKALIL